MGRPRGVVRAVATGQALAVRVGVLTGGGDCPGLNAVIRAAGRRVMTRGGVVVGVREGWKGLVDGLFEPLGPR